MSIASIGAFAIGEYSEAVFVMALYGIGELFEDYASDKSKKDIDTLINNMPSCATVIRDGSEITLPPNEVSVHDTVLIKPGEKVPVDGILLSKGCFLNLLYLNGESVPKRHNAGDKILSGSINGNTPVLIEATSTADKSAAARILELTVSSAEKKAKPEKFITKFSRYYTPAVMIASLIFFIVSLLSGKPLTRSIYDALVLLVISCPCALVISVPLSYFGGIGACSREKILIKGSSYLETLSKTKNVLLDKTGTVTKGNFAVSEVFPETYSREELLNFAATAERYSTHPIALSIKNEGKILGDITSEEIPGRGIKALWGSTDIAVGNGKLMEDIGVSYRVPDSNATTVYVAVSGKYAGAITISDELKDGVENLPSLLKKQGICRVEIVSGDSNDTVSSVAEKISADAAFGNMYPEDKVTHLEEIKKTGVTVFIGDGINDTPVIASADVSGTMGNLGSDSAIEFADMVFLDDNPLKLVSALKIARKTHKTAIFNIIFSLSVKAVVLLLSLFGFVGMWAATFSDVGVLILVTLNAMRLLKN